MLYMYLSALETDEERLTFSKLYEETHLACEYVALSITNDHSVAEDVVHNAFLYVIKNKEKIFNLSCEKRKSYILLITKHRAIDYIRSQKRRDIEYIDELQDVSDNVDLSDYIKSQEAYEHLINTIENLPEKYRTVFEMRYIQDMSNMEIADVLGITNKAVSTRISRAKLKLLEKIDKELAYG
ncbi:MAG: RNA polymerase sigma factor [Defluviitaleaceae bacterium]|nr:RNA polymerase sigma factor [Defluviitaleaceae bacterium]